MQSSTAAASAHATYSRSAPPPPSSSKLWDHRQRGTCAEAALRAGSKPSAAALVAQLIAGTMGRTVALQGRKSSVVRQRGALRCGYPLELLDSFCWNRKCEIKKFTTLINSGALCFCGKSIDSARA